MSEINLSLAVGHQEADQPVRLLAAAGAYQSTHGDGANPANRSHGSNAT